MAGLNHGKRAFPLLLLACLALAACGKRGDLAPADGKMPPAPVGASASPTIKQMLTPPPQAAPERVDDPIKRSEERREDRFELPPPG